MNEGIGYVVQNLPSVGMRTLEHLYVVSAALAVALPVGLAVGIMLSRPSLTRLRGPALFVIGLGQTIPSIAVLALAISYLGVGSGPAIVAITLYAIIPVARASSAALLGVDPAIVDAARGSGMSALQVIRQVEIPLASPGVIAGVRLAAVGGISAGALAYLIGAGGLGEFIFTGISLLHTTAMLVGAVPAVTLAILIDRLLDLVERRAMRRSHAT